jgi:hypothetical protein
MLKYKYLKRFSIFLHKILFFAKFYNNNYLFIFKKLFFEIL